MAVSVESLLVTLAAVVAAILAMMLVARLMLGTQQATSRITTGRYLLTAVIALVLIFVVSLIGWPRGFGNLGPVATLVALVYCIKVVLLPDTAPSEQWPRSVWMAVITYTIFLLVNAGAQAIFNVEPFTL